eukprot:TRINITY_DN11565_c0_g1_i1.p2 TRINITY_DN11565_c0_g1~~TRINITY_DN11565_c0_g1_i1.p2  ORF type:complete len:126 (+),score=32.20 TRINITY_DN11565_c0_g1_i1:46-423(+)
MQRELSDKVKALKFMRKQGERKDATSNHLQVLHEQRQRELQEGTGEPVVIEDFAFPMHLQVFGRRSYLGFNPKQERTFAAETKRLDRESGYAQPDASEAEGQAIDTSSLSELGKSTMPFYKRQRV